MDNKKLKDLEYFVLANILADSSFICLLFTMSILLFIEPDNNDYSLFTKIILGLIYGFFIIGRLFVLPIAYNIMEKSSKFELSKKYIHLLKTSWKARIIVLAIAFCYFPPLLEFSLKRLQNQLLWTTSMGLFGSYIVLFIYWYISDKIKSFKKKTSH